MITIILVAATLSIHGTIEGSMLVEISPETIRSYEVNLPGGATKERCVRRTADTLADMLARASADYPGRHLVREVAATRCETRDAIGWRLARDEGRETRGERREARDEGRETRGERRETRDERPEARDERPERKSWQ